ncbi:hypothetical protein QX776_15420 [Alteromonadaceae bacterium BrNp21-10]|nr:hypothetical protein [Alteromonadaceae bacterium BrNp21-10]
MKRILVTLVTVVGLIINLGVVAAPSAEQTAPQPKIKSIDAPKRVMFVGNSFSYFNNGIANHYSNLVRASGAWEKGEYGSRLKTISGGRLHEHVPGVANLLKLPGDNHWDVVVLQDYSNGPIKSKSRKAFKQASAELSKMVRAHAAKPVFFMTWGYKGNAAMTTELRDAYVRQGNALNMLVVPVGLAFAAAQQSHPDIELYSKDVQGFGAEGKVIYRSVEKHPSVAGTYLAACTFYASLQGKTPDGLPYTADLPAKQVKALQQIAWQTSQQFYQ